VNWHTRVRDAFAAHGHVSDSDIVEELGQHAASAFQTARADGVSQETAEHQVDALIEAWIADGGVLRRRLRRPAVIEPPVPSRPSHSSFAGVLQDARYGIRLLRREPGFMAVAILTMALGIGATTTLFSVAYGVLLKPLPWPDAERLVRITEARGGRIGRVRGTMMNGSFLAWADHPATIDALAGWRRQVMTMTVGGGEPGRVPVIPITPSAFPMLQARPLVGRVFAAAEGARGAPGVALLSYGLWQQRFGGRKEVVGQEVRLDDQPYTIVGVMPREFFFPDREARLWTAWAVPPVAGSGVLTGVIFSALARLRDGATPEQATAEATARARNGPDASLVGMALFGAKGPIDVRATPARDALTAEVKPAIVVLLAAVALLLLTATANVASLQLARAARRRHEMAVRAAIGAGAARLARQLLVESAMLGLAGGAAGLALAAALHHVLPAVLPADFPRLDDVAMDGRVLLFAVAVSLVTSVVCGLMPALHARRVNLVESLGDGATARRGTGAQTARVRTMIMAGQVAVACMLLVGAALLGRSFIALTHAERGYDPANLLTARIPLPASYSMERRIQLLEGLVSRLRGVAGVREAAYGNALPLLTSGGFRAFKMRPPSDPSTEIDVNTIERVVSPGYFSALGLHVRQGRALSEADTMSAPQAIVVNRSFAATYLGGNPMGVVVPNLGMCRSDSDRWQVVGVVDDMRQGPVTDSPQPEVFIPFRQIACTNAVPDPVLLVRTAADPSPYAPMLRDLFREQAPSLALDSVMTMDDRVMTSLARPRTYALLLGGFAMFALAIAGVGLFGVLSYSVAQRTREIGVRTALGAQTRDIVHMVFRQGLAIAGAGVALGLLMSAAAVRSLSAFLYGVASYDAASFIVVPMVLAAVAVVACLVPARRAARIDPLRALRES
jgi:putative ABC transport system permease protein